MDIMELKANRDELKDFDPTEGKVIPENKLKFAENDELDGERVSSFSNRLKNKGVSLDVKPHRGEGESSSGSSARNKENKNPRLKDMEAGDAHSSQHHTLKELGKPDGMKLKHWLVHNSTTYILINLFRFVCFIVFQCILTKYQFPR